MLPHACRVALALVGWSVVVPKPSRASQPYLPISAPRDGPREVGVHPAALSLTQCRVTVIQKHIVKAWGERGVEESKRKVCLLENRIWLVRWSSCTWLGNLSLAPSLKVFELTSQEECYSCWLIFPSGGMRQSSIFKRPIYGPKYKKLFLWLQVRVLKSCLTQGCRLAATYGHEGGFHACAPCGICY